MDQFLVVTPGAYTTVQDRGRLGYQKMGVPVSGALDADAMSMANRLVGNMPDRAVLEVTIMGPTLEVLSDADVAVCGADIGMTLNDAPVPVWRTISVASGDVLDIHQVKGGCRAYLAVTGGIAVPPVMGSRSTYPGGRLGGYKGRPLKTGDVLQAGGGRRVSAAREIPVDYRPDHPGRIALRAVAGPQDDFFDLGLERLFSSEFMVTAKADRMGYRLQGPEIPIVDGMPRSIVSEPSMPGSIQIPADHQPIVLLVEQTVGGYAKIATVISVDLPKVAQATPGDIFAFERVDLDTAHRLSRKHREKMAALEDMLS